MNWHAVPKITGGVCCMVVLAIGIMAGIDPVLCVTRGIIGGALGWVAGAFWAYLLSHALPPEPIAETQLPITETVEPQEGISKNEANLSQENE
jgi:hypothetical protein